MWSRARSYQTTTTVLLAASRMAPQQRLAMVSKHLSTSSSSSSSSSAAAAAAPQASGSSSDAPVQFEAVHALRKITLNRPKALNSLSDEMVDLIQPQLEKYESSSLANVVLFKSNSKHFCAGGDVKALVQQLGDEKTWKLSSGFFQKEYTMNAFLANMKKPVISFMHGTTLGGGVGLSMHIPFRIATETTSLGMPETNIGLFPDVGANFFLPRLDGQLGVYLGLTGHFLKGKSAFFSGFASHFVPSERLEALEQRLAELDQSATLDDVNAAINEFAADAEEIKGAGPAYELAGARRRAIDLIFGRATAEEMLQGLKDLEEGTLDMSQIVIEGETLDMSELQRWARDTRAELERRSPTSIKLALKGIREGAKLDIDEAFLMDVRIGTACCNPEIHPDFKNGVTHLLIDKKKGRAPWNPSTLEQVTDASLTKNFFSSPPPFSNPPLPKLVFRHKSASKPYKQYPHARFSLPSENAIRDVVTGEARGSGQYALTRDEVVKHFVKLTNGKVGVEEKVTDVVARKCKAGQEGTLKWLY